VHDLLRKRFLFSNPFIHPAVKNGYIFYSCVLQGAGDTGALITQPRRIHATGDDNPRVKPDSEVAYGIIQVIRFGDLRKKTVFLVCP